MDTYLFLMNIMYFNAGSTRFDGKLFCLRHAHIAGYIHTKYSGAVTTNSTRQDLRQ